MKRFALIVLISAAMTVAMMAAAYAASPGGGIMRADANQDGVLTREEHEAQRMAMFKRLDRDNSGALTAEEFAAARQQMQERRAQAGKNAREGGGEAWKLLDRNQDGKVELTEFVSGDRMFERVDADKDGRITAEERQQAWQGRKQN